MQLSWIALLRCYRGYSGWCSNPDRRAISVFPLRARHPMVRWHHQRHRADRCARVPRERCALHQRQRDFISPSGRTPRHRHRI